MRTLRERLLSQAIIDPETGCWLWTGLKNWKGYGRIWRDGREVLTHRAAYELLIGEVPKGLVLDHLCRVRHCVNPYHLEPVTHRVNILRGTSSSQAVINARKTHCHRGHPFNEENTGRTSRGTRICLTCSPKKRTSSVIGPAESPDARAEQPHTDLCRMRINEERPVKEKTGGRATVTALAAIVVVNSLGLSDRGGSSSSEPAQSIQGA